MLCQQRMLSLISISKVFNLDILTINLASFSAHNLTLMDSSPNSGVALNGRHTSNEFYGWEESRRDAFRRPRKYVRNFWIDKLL